MKGQPFLDDKQGPTVHNFICLQCFSRLSGEPHRIQIDTEKKHRYHNSFKVAPTGRSICQLMLSACLSVGGHPTAVAWPPVWILLLCRRLGRGLSLRRCCYITTVMEVVGFQ